MAKSGKKGGGSKSKTDAKPMSAQDHRKLAETHHARARLHSAKADLMDAKNPPKKNTPKPYY